MQEISPYFSQEKVAGQGKQPCWKEGKQEKECCYNLKSYWRKHQGKGCGPSLDVS